MAEFVSFDPNVEATGQMVLPVLAALDEGCKPVLEKYGLGDVESDGWYPLQDFLDALRELSENGYFNMVSIGMKVPDVAVFPPDIETIEDVFTLLDQAYHMNHRGGDIGEYIYRQTGERSGELYCNNPYSSDFDYGLIYRLLQKYRPVDSEVFSVTRDDSVPNRKSGGDACTYYIEW